AKVRDSPTRTTKCQQNLALWVVIAESGDYPTDMVRFSPLVYGHPELRELELTINGRAAIQPLRAGQRDWLCRTLDVQA
ncbi:MAG TPA: hypothetical protein P5032_16550, partial [Candidatus Competibacter sp.]|nr:hypothetical protein [Candidatus Competibacter sp.]